jgi:hypothetical protein
MVNAAPGYDYVIDRFDVEGGQDHDWFLHGMIEQEGVLETSISVANPVASLVPAWGGSEIPKTQYEVDPKRFHPYRYMRDIKSGNASEKAWTATWKYDAGVGLRVHNLSPQGAQVYRFRSPGVRPAREDDNKLENFMHNGIMQRSSGKPSSFITVHEPFRNTTWIESVQKEGDVVVVRYKLNGTAVEDRIAIKDDEITVSSSAGWKYASGTAHSGKVESLQVVDGKYRLQLDKAAPGVNFVRLDRADGGTHYYPVTSVNGTSIELVDDPGFTMGTDGKVVFHTFPKDQYEGGLKYTVFAK